MTVVAAQGLTIRRGQNTILDGVDLQVSRGDLVVILGPNGAGKTTLLRSMLGLERPAEGQVMVDGVDTRSLSGRQRAGCLGWLSQRRGLGEPLTARELVVAARFRFSETVAESRRAADDALSTLGLTHLAHRPVDRLSGGEAQRVATAALLAQDAAIWLADEPANHLDPAVQLSVYDVLRDQWLAGRGLVVVTHDVTLLTDLAPDRPSDVRVVGIKGGRVTLRSHLDDADLAEALSDLYQVSVRAVQVDGRPRLVVTR